MEDNSKRNSSRNYSDDDSVDFGELSAVLTNFVAIAMVGRLDAVDVSAQGYEYENFGSCILCVQGNRDGNGSSDCQV